MSLSQTAPQDDSLFARKGQAVSAGRRAVDQDDAPLTEAIKPAAATAPLSLLDGMGVERPPASVEPAPAGSLLKFRLRGAMRSSLVELLGAPPTEEPAAAPAAEPGKTTRANAAPTPSLAPLPQSRALVAVGPALTPLSARAWPGRAIFAFAAAALVAFLAAGWTIYGLVSAGPQETTAAGATAPTVVTERATAANTGTETLPIAAPAVALSAPEPTNETAVGRTAAEPAETAIDKAMMAITEAAPAAGGKPAAAAGIVAASFRPIPQPKPTPPADLVNAQTGGSVFLVQLASVRSAADAEREWRRLQREFPALLANRALRVDRAAIDDRGTYYRVRTGPFADRRAARAVCARLADEQQSCLVVRR